MILKKILLFITFCFCSGLLYAQQKNKESTAETYRAVHWGIEEDLSQGDVADMIKDINGFLWIGTSFGLNRFDGNTFKKYLADKSKKSKTIIDNSIYGLIEDSLHNIWIGTDSGLSCYDIMADTFRNFSSGFPGHMIIPFWATRNEIFCNVYADTGDREFFVTTFNINSFAKKILVKFSPADNIASLRYSIFDAGSKSIWMEEGDPNKPGGGLLQISIPNGKREHYGWDCYKNITGHSHASEGMRYDLERNCIWINSNDGLLQFTLDDKKFHYVDALDKLADLKDYEKWAKDWHWVGIDLDPQGRVWLATVRKGIVIYDPATDSARLPFGKDTALQRDASDFNVRLYCDRDGIGWTGFWKRKGIFQLIPLSPAVTRYAAGVGPPHGVSNNNVAMCINADSGRLWMSTPDGINIFDPHTGLFKLIRDNDLLGTKGHIFPIKVDSISKKAWIFKFGHGLFELDLSTKKWRPVIYKDSTGQKIDSLFMVPKPYKNGCMIIASYGDQQGIFIVDSHIPVARHILTLPAGNIDYFTSTTNDDNGLFLRRPDARSNLTYTNRDGQWIQTITPLDSIQWRQIIYNKSDQTYWIIAGTNLLHYSKNFVMIHTYSREEGLPDLEIYDLIPDNNGNIWFNTDRSLHQLNINSGIITTLSEKDGFLPQNFTKIGLASAKDEDGQLYFPAGFYGVGFDRINPDRYIFTPSAVYLESLEINQQAFPLSTGINDLQELSLRYFENKITIATGTIDYYSKDKGHLRYKLERNGKREVWQYSPAFYTIRYEDLPPGSYRLVMQASNLDNEFNSPEKILMIEISPPFWATWWFRMIMMIALLLLFYGTYQWRTVSLRKQKRILEQTVKQRTAEVVEEKVVVENTLQELRSTQAQLIQSEKMASLGELTAGIAHEIQNPLNFVNNFSEINTELIYEMQQEMEKGNLDDAKTISNDIKENEQKINHHGKRADAIVKGMLQHSKTSTGQKESTDINKLAEEYFRLAYHGLRAKDKSFNATLKTDFDETIGNINIIPQDIGRVLLNLYNNAFYAVNEKSRQSALPASADPANKYEPAVSVSTKSTSDKIEITVTDNGNGIAQKLIDKIFQPFFTTKPTGQGTGLGLSLSYDIVKAHGGEIRVESKESEGSNFYIELPV